MQRYDIFFILQIFGLLFCRYFSKFSIFTDFTFYIKMRVRDKKRSFPVSHFFGMPSGFVRDFSFLNDYNQRADFWIRV